MTRPVDRRMPDAYTEPTISIERAAAVLGISRKGAYLAADRGELPTVSVGRRRIVPTQRFLTTFGLDGPPLPVG